MKTLTLVILFLLACLLCKAMGFPHVNDFIYECGSPNKASEEKRSIKELPNKQPSNGQKNSYSVEGCRANGAYLSLPSKLFSMTTLFQRGIVFPLQSIFHLTSANFSFIKKIRPVKTHQAFTILVILQSLITFSAPSQAQVKVEKGLMEAVIYIANENPFVVYVRLDNPKGEAVSVIVYGQKDKILFRERVIRNKYNFKLDLSQLPNGEYRVEVANQRKKITKDIFIQTLYQQKTQRIVSLSDLAGN